MGRSHKAKQPLLTPTEPEEESQEVSEEESEVKEDAKEKGLNKSQSARAAIEAGYEKPVDAVAYIKREFGIDMNPQHFSSIKTGYKKAQGGAKSGKGASSSTPKRRRATPTIDGYVAPPPKQADGGDLLDTLEALKPLIAQHGPDKLKRMVDLLG